MKVGLVLSGGGIRGIAHLGVLKAMEEKNIRVSIISATSAGAMIGALYSHGYRPEFILEKIISTRFFKVLKPAWSLQGMLNMDKIGNLLLEFLPENDFSSLKIPLIIAATNLQKGVTEYFDSGELIAPVLCSSCIPVVFNPVKFNENLYIDGGVLNNLPVQPLTSRSDFIIGSHCNPIDDNYQRGGFKTLIERTMLMAINGNVKISKPMCDILIEPPELKKFGGFELSKAKKIFAIGYEAAIESIEKDFPK